MTSHYEDWKDDEISHSNGCRCVRCDPINAERLALRSEVEALRAEKDAAVLAERERCAKLVDPGALEAWEVRGGLEGIYLMRDLADAIRGAALAAGEGK